MQVYSTPMTPPPTTMRVLGRVGRSSTWSLLMMVRPLMGTLGETAGLVPTAMMMRSASIVAASLRAFVRGRGVGSIEAGDAVDDVDAVAGELGLGDVHFGLDDVLNAEGEIGHGDLLLDPIVHAVDGAVVVAGEVQDRLAHGLGGDGAGVDADAADRAHALDHGDLLSLLGGVDSGALSSRAGSDDDEVVVSHAQRSRVSKFDEWRTNSASPYPTPPTLRFASSSSFKLR